MKTLLVLTDFSAEADHATRYAAIVASRLRANLLLQHAYFTDPVLPVYAGQPLDVAYALDEEYTRLSLDRLARSLLADMGKIPGGYTPRVFIQNRPGTLVQVVAETLATKNICMVVAGASKGSMLDHLLSGHSTRQLIDTVNCPLLVVPPQAPLSLPVNMIFATDFEPIELGPLKKLSRVSSRLNIKVILGHVNRSGKAVLDTGIHRLFLNLSATKLDYVEVRGKDVARRLARLCREKSASLLAMVHVRQSFVERLFEQSNTANALKSQHIPLLVFPAQHSAQ